MPLAALLLLASGAQPSPGLAAAFHGELQLVLGQDEGPPPGSAYPPPPPLVRDQPAPELAPPPVVVSPTPVPGGAYPAPPSTAPLDLAPAPTPPPAAQKTVGSASAAFWESSALNLLETGVLDTAGALLLGAGFLVLNPPCGGTPNLGGGIPLVILGLAAVLAQPFAVAGTTRWLYSLQGIDVDYLTALGGDALAYFVAGPLAGLLLGAIVSAAGGSNAGGAAAGVGVTAFAVISAMGAPAAGSIWGKPAAPLQPASAPLVHLAF